MPILESVLVHNAKTGGPVPGALVVWWDQGGRSDARTTDGSGFCNFGRVQSGGLTMAVSAPGYAGANFYKQDDAATLTVTLEPSAAPFEVRPEAGFLHIAPMPFSSTHGESDLKRWRFLREDGSPFFLAAYTMHTLICNVAKGQDLAWVWAYLDAIGANAVLVITNHMSQWKKDNGFYYSALDPAHPGILARLFDEAAAHGKRVLHQSLADAQSLTVKQKQQIYETDCGVARGRWNILKGKGNEGGVNGWAPDELPNYRAADLGGVLTSQGSRGGGEEPYMPALDFSQWETRIEPMFKLCDDAGAGILEQYQGYGDNASGHTFPPTCCPVIISETRIYNDVNPDLYGDFRGTDPNEAALVGANAGACAEGFCFGTTEGLVARPNGPIADACTRRAFKAAWASYRALYA